MLSIRRKASSLPSAQSWFRRIPWLLIPVLALSFTLAHAQNLTGTISGIVTDQTDARIPGAKVIMTNDASGDARSSVADSQGFFSITALPPATYTVTISSKGFVSWKETGIVLNQGDSRTVPDIKLKPGAQGEAITVISGQEAEVPVDNAEVSATLNNDLVDSATLTGRNAAELMKMMPGVVFNNAGGVGSSYNSTTTGTNNGPAGAFSANGTQPNGSTAIILDGANLLDPGNAGTQVANINQDMTDSVKFASASYGAEYAKGPAVLEAFSKSGGQKYHGELYVYARDSAFGYANDPYNKDIQAANFATLNPGATAAQIAGSNQVNAQHFYYMGGNVGGPISFGGFNKNKDKLFFWAGYEKMLQDPYNNPVVMNVPTGSAGPNPNGQLGGDFSNTGVNPKTISTWPAAYALPCSGDGGWEGCSAAVSPWVAGTYTAQGLQQYFDPNGKILNSFNPAANAAPNAVNGWNNYVYSPATPTNRWEATGKVNYSFNENNKLWGSYAYQTENDEHPLSIWWAPEWTVPYPGKPNAVETAHVYLANFTHVFNATTTNEVVFAYAKFVNDASISNKTAVSRDSLGFAQQSIFGSPGTDQMPNSTGGWNSGLTELNEFDFYNSGIYGKNSFGKTATLPSIADNFTKIVRTHSIKAGFYWDTQENLQANGSDTNGNYDFENWGASSTGNLTLDRLMGRVFDYDQFSSDVVPDITQHEWSLWAQDSWKASRKLTLNLGLRADHEGQWYDKLGGTQVFDLNTYNAQFALNPSTPNIGLLWNKIDSKIPTSGWSSQLFFYNPRLGVAYDVFGTGKTVIRGGFGTYRYQVSAGDASGAMNGPLGSYDYNTNSTGGNQGFFGYGVQGGTLCGGVAWSGSPLSTTCTGTSTLTIPNGFNQDGESGFKADSEGDKRVPYADTYSFGLAQALPAHTVIQASYVGSVSHNQLENGQNGHIQDPNALNFGVFDTEPDPKTGLVENLSPLFPAAYNTPAYANWSVASENTNDYHPLSAYGDIWLQTHGGHANYNSLQVAAQKQSGNLFLFTNFTFGKVLGTRDGSTSNGNGNGTVANPFDFESNYGQLEYDHTKVFNASYSYKLPKPIHNNLILGEVINGWQISGYTTYQDGIPYQSGNVNMNMNYQQYHDALGNVTNTPFTQNLPATAYAILKNAGGTVVGSQINVGNQTETISDTTFWGSNQPENGLMPVLTCDPRHGLHKGQYFNPSCFRAPLPSTATSYGEVGQTVWPYIRTPHYWGSDMAIFKAFKINDAQRIEFRASATNWLNHPNAGFGINGNSDNQLLFNGLASASNVITNTNSSTTGVPSTKEGFRWMQFGAKYYF